MEKTLSLSPLASPDDESPRKKKIDTEPSTTMGEQFHKFAQEDTPMNVSVPGNMPGLIMWAIGRHGPIVLFVATTWFLYQDNKAYQAQMIEVVRSQISVNTQQVLINTQVVSLMGEVKSAMSAITEEAKRAHTIYPTKP